MAEYLIQSETLTDIANAIRGKTGESGAIDTLQMASKINGIPTGATIQRKTGSFTTNTSGKATISDVGFQPDLITIFLTNYNGTTEEGLSIPFAEQSYPSLSYTAVGYASDGIYEAAMTRSSTGFTVTMYNLGWNMGYSVLRNKTFNYIATKYTE